jgi:DNA topoisomerase I
MLGSLFCCGSSRRKAGVRGRDQMLKEATQVKDVALSSEESAEEAGLSFVSDDLAGITRRRWRRLFAYSLPNGNEVRDERTLNRIRALAIPPAWKDVWICPRADGHIQATGRDARGRKQYRYHADFTRVRDEAKFDRLLEFGKALPKVRRTIDRHMREKGLGRRKVLATVAYLLDKTLVRVGNREYARDNKSYGLTTLQDRHVSFSSSELRFKFRGKTGKEWNLKLHDRRIARIVRSCQDLPGQHLFQYEEDDGTVRQVSSSDINDYIRSIAGPDVSAKDFRTWAGTVLAAMALNGCEPFDSATAAKYNVRMAIETVASKLGNTPAICRKCYVHPEVLAAYNDGKLAKLLKRAPGKTLKRAFAALPKEEAATLLLLHIRTRMRRC